MSVMSIEKVLSYPDIVFLQVSTFAHVDAAATHFYGKLKRRASFYKLRGKYTTNGTVYTSWKTEELEYVLTPEEVIERNRLHRNGFGGRSYVLGDSTKAFCGLEALRKFAISRWKKFHPKPMSHVGVRMLLEGKPDDFQPHLCLDIDGANWNDPETAERIKIELNELYGLYQRYMELDIIDAARTVSKRWIAKIASLFDGVNPECMQP